MCLSLISSVVGSRGVLVLLGRSQAQDRIAGHCGGPENYRAWWPSPMTKIAISRIAAKKCSKGWNGQQPPASFLLGGPAKLEKG